MVIGGNYIKENIQPEVNLQYKHLNWEETFMIEATTTGIVYDTQGVNDNITQENLYKQKGMTALSSRHYAVKTVNDVNVDEFFPECYYDVTYFKLPPGNNLWWHKDYYSFFQKKFNIKKRKSNSIHRTIITLENWVPGQIFAVEDNIAFDWKKGNSYTFQENLWHGVGNFSLEEYVIMQVTWIKKKDVINDQ